MSKQFAVRRLDSLAAPSFCDGAYAIANFGTDWSFLWGVYTGGITGYYMLACYYL